jgi:hypothetical protein
VLRVRNRDILMNSLITTIEVVSSPPPPSE